MDFTLIKSKLESLGYVVSCFDTMMEAADYLDSQIVEERLVLVVR